jgi:hypothetical protein
MCLFGRRADRKRLGCLVFVLLFCAPSAFAQYVGHDLRGDNGLSAGSEPLPGVYVVVPFYNYDIGSLLDRNGNEKTSSVALPTMQGWGASVAVVTKAKVLGAHYGLAIAPLFYMQDVIDVPRAGLHKATGFSYFDTFYQPLMLGWTTKQADFIAGYGFFAPTGDFSAHQGLGMWSHDISGGTTVYFGKARRVTAATAATLEIHTKNQDKDIHVGNILTLEGGVGARFLKGAAAAGLAYYAQWKVSDDSGTDIPVIALSALNLLGKQKVYGLGPEITIPFFAKGTTVGVATVRYFWETGATSSFQGQALLVSVALAKLWVP